MNEFSRKLLQDAYQHFASSGDRLYVTVPKDPDYLKNLLSATESLFADGYIEDLSYNLKILIQFLLFL